MEVERSSPATGARHNIINEEFLNRCTEHTMRLFYEWSVPTDLLKRKPCHNEPIITIIRRRLMPVQALKDSIMHAQPHSHTHTGVRCGGVLAIAMDTRISLPTHPLSRPGANSELSQCTLARKLDTCETGLYDADAGRTRISVMLAWGRARLTAGH